MKIPRFLAEAIGLVIYQMGNTLEGEDQDFVFGHMKSEMPIRHPKEMASKQVTELEVHTGNVHLEDVSERMELGKCHLVCSLPCGTVLTLAGLRLALNLEKGEMARAFLLM